MSTLAIVLIVMVVVAVPLLGMFSTLAIYGVRKFIVNAKTAEARNTLGQLARSAVAAYEHDGAKATVGHTARRLCPSAARSIPADRSMISGHKYQSSPAEWEIDRAENAGFSCLEFQLSTPQYYQYEYTATESEFVARAFGDLNGDGVFSKFELHGHIEDGRLLVDPSIEETSPEE